MELEAGKIVELHHEIKNKRPVIHCITNAVTVNDCANILLAAGASPTMAHHPLEVEEITEGAAALVCNLGAIADFEAMEKAGKKADEMGHAIVLDPVGISGSTYRRMQCQTLIKEIHPTCIRGNYSEIRALLKAVSYTHLDVYKRQEQDSLLRRESFSSRESIIWLEYCFRTSPWKSWSGFFVRRIVAFIPGLISSIPMKPPIPSLHINAWISFSMLLILLALSSLSLIHI